MMLRSPRCSDRAHAHLLTVTGARSANPLPKTRREHVTFHMCSECMGLSSPREKMRFSKMGWDYAR